MIPTNDRSNRSSLAVEMEGGQITMKDVFVIQSFKAMGLTDQTM